jgi:1-acyl-sn-glycerol-3-phosphate acyltransferase
MLLPRSLARARAPMRCECGSRAMFVSPPIYRLALPLVRVALTLYFRSIESVGRPHLPPSGPALLAANHPQSITDALVLAVACERPVHYLAHSGLFRRRPVAWFLHRCGVIPIHRPSDDASAAARNVHAFSACFELLERGGVIGIFPEGSSRDERRVQALRTGVSRIALEAEARHGFGLGVLIVPVGLNFESTRRFRSRVLVRFDVPIPASAYLERYAADPVDAVHELTQEIGTRIRRSVVHLERNELRELIERIESFYHEHLLDHPRLAIEGGTDFQRRQTLLRGIASAVDALYERRPDRLWHLRAELETYDGQLRRLRLNDELLRNHSRPNVGTRALRLVLLALLCAPALYGLIFNYLPYRVTGPLAARATRDATKTHYFQLWIGTLAFAAYYGAAMLWLVWRFDPTPLARWALLLSWPLSGLLARLYVLAVARQRRLLRLSVLAATQGAALQRLRRLRQRLVAQMDSLLRHYLANREEET